MEKVTQTVILAPIQALFALGVKDLEIYNVSLAEEKVLMQKAIHVILVKEVELVCVLIVQEKANGCAINVVERKK